MLTQTEKEVLLAAIAQAKMSGGLLQNISAPITQRDNGSPFTWRDLHRSAFPVSEDTFAAFTENNKAPAAFADFPRELDLELYAQRAFDSLTAMEANRWRVFFTLSLPGLSQNGRSALVQVTAYCPAGPPNYGGLYLLEKTVSGWQVQFQHGLFNQ